MALAPAGEATIRAVALIRVWMARAESLSNFESKS